jgi:hypothetical protein
MHLEDLQRMISEAAAQMPPPPLNQPENELRPDPAKLRARIEFLEMRLEALERWAIAMNPTFWHFQKFEMQKPKSQEG